jgi:signal transduction histidine kinase
MPERAQQNDTEIWHWLAARLFPRGNNMIFWAAYVILIGLIISYVLNPPQGIGVFRYYSSLMVVSVILVINIVWDDLVGLFPNRSTGQWTLLLISAGLTFYAVAAGQMYIAIYAIFMISAQANAMLPGTPAVAFSAAMAAVYLFLLSLSGASPSELQATVMGLLIGLTFTITLSQVLHRYTQQTERANQLLAQLQQAHAELIAARQNEKDLAVAEERVRMARDLHDGLGHHLTALSIQLQAAEKLLTTNPVMAADAVRAARGEVQAALKEVRQSVAVLREAPVDLQNLPEVIAGLVEEAGRVSGLQARFHLAGEVHQVSPAAAVTLYRAAQEGLTNVQKHASGARSVEVTLEYAAEETRLTVRDDGQATVVPHLGFGLPGLHERAALLGGRLEHRSRPEGGFTLRMVLPGLPVAERPGDKP